MLKPRTNWEIKKDQPLIKAAMALTKCDIKTFEQYVVLINGNHFPESKQKDMAMFVKMVQDNVIKLKGDFDDFTFSISYKHYFGNQTCLDLARELYLDKSTVVKMNQKFILKLSEYLYPEYHSFNGGELNE